MKYEKRFEKNYDCVGAISTERREGCWARAAKEPWRQELAEYPFS